MMKTLLITGASQGIGAALAKAYLNKGYRVINLDIVPPQNNQSNEYYQFHECDISNQTTVANLFATLPHIDSIILNAAIFDQTPFLKQSIDELTKIVQTNVIGHIHIAKLYAKQYVQNSGRIIIISSTRATMSEANTIGYSVSKGALNALTHALAVTLKEKHITVNSIAPGWINSHDEVLRGIDHKFHLSQRVGKSSDIVNACFYLTDETNDFVNGTVLTIDGGATKTMIYPK